MEHFTSVSPFWANSHCKEQQQPRTAGRQQARRATTTGAASRSTQEGTTNCVMTASLRAFDGGLCDGVGPSCHGLVINLLGFLITLLDAAQTWCSWLFLFSLCSWSSQGQTWMCPWFSKISTADFLETWCCQITTFVELVLASLPGKAFLNAFSHGPGSKDLRVRKSRRTETLSAKEPSS